MMNAYLTSATSASAIRSDNAANMALQAHAQGRESFILSLSYRHPVIGDMVGQFLEAAQTRHNKNFDMQTA